MCAIIFGHSNSVSRLNLRCGIRAQYKQPILPQLEVTFEPSPRPITSPCISHFGPQLHVAFSDTSSPHCHHSLAPLMSQDEMTPRQSGGCSHMAVNRTSTRYNAPAYTRPQTQSKIIRRYGQIHLFSHLWSIVLLISLLPYSCSGACADACASLPLRSHNAVHTYPRFHNDMFARRLPSSQIK